MKKIIEAIKNYKYKKDLLLVAIVVLAGFMALGGIGDYSKTKFWWTFWDVAQVVSLVGLIGGWIYLYAKDRIASKGK